MTIPVHRITDARICGAKTEPAGNSDVFANNLLVAVNGDPNSHGGGGLIAHSNQVFADNILTVNHTADTANPDAICPIPPHCGPSTDQGSPNVFTGDPSAPPPVPILAPEIIAAINHVDTFLETGENSPEGEPEEELEPIEVEEQAKPNHNTTVAIETTVAQETPEAQVYADICHPFDGKLDQLLLEAAQGLWIEKGLYYDEAKITKKNKSGAVGYKYAGAVGGKHYYAKPDGTPDLEYEFQNKKILDIWNDLGGINGSQLWETDQTAWCAGFVNWVLQRSGYRYLQSASAKDVFRRQADYQSTEIKDFRDAKCGDICYWSYSHVNFVYTNNPDTFKMSFVGGNQGTGRMPGSLGKNNPAGGSITQSWAGNAKSPYNPNGKEGGDGAYKYGGTRTHDTKLQRIFRPKAI
ncbi:MAG: hypothetical protein CMA31_02005 [Euryarchaeota archaeon]|nr:hypothetical protein [Euryarchaeota archaeon]